MNAQILMSDEVDDLAGRVTNAVVDVLADLGSELSDAALRVAVDELVCAARAQLAAAPVDPAPMVRAILRRSPSGRPLFDDQEDEFGVALARPVAPALVAAAPVTGEAVASVPDAAVVAARMSTEVVVVPVMTEVVAAEAPNTGDAVAQMLAELLAADAEPAGDLALAANVPDPVVLAQPVLVRAAPAYWPAVPAISDELFAVYTASQELEENAGLPHQQCDGQGKCDGQCEGDGQCNSEGAHGCVTQIALTQVAITLADTMLAPGPAPVVTASPFAIPTPETEANDGFYAGLEGEPVHELAPAVEVAPAVEDLNSVSHFYARAFGRNHKSRR